MKRQDYEAFLSLVKEKLPDVDVYAFDYQTKKPEIHNFYIKVEFRTTFIIHFDPGTVNNKWEYSFIPVYNDEDHGERDFYCEVACFTKQEWLEFIADVHNVIAYADGVLELLSL